MTLQVRHLDDVVPQPWRNGGGVTRELLAWPSAESWLLRLSVADIEKDGPFSSFPGIDRWFAVLSGSGVRLGAGLGAVFTGDAPMHFDGALAPPCELIKGPTRDLNLMFRRDGAAGNLTQVTSRYSWHAEKADVRGVFTMKGCKLQVGMDAIDVAPMSLVWQGAVPPDQTWVVTCEANDRSTFVFQCAGSVPEPNSVTHE